jgi:hypothetical protein
MYNDVISLCRRESLSSDFVRDVNRPLVEDSDINVGAIVDQHDGQNYIWPYSDTIGSLSRDMVTVRCCDTWPIDYL